MRGPRPKWYPETIAKVKQMLIDGWSPAETAHRAAVSLSTVRRISRDLKEEADRRTVPRCRCGLALPCSDCIPTTLAEFMATRMRSGAGT